MKQTLALTVRPNPKSTRIGKMRVIVAARAAGLRHKEKGRRSLGTGPNTDTPDASGEARSNPLPEVKNVSVGTTEPERKSLSDKAFRQRRPARDTSIDALQSQDEETTAHRRNRIWSFIAEQGGATCWEVEQEFDALHQTISAAISNLSAAGLLVDTGKRRPTGSGRLAIVWGAVQ